MSSKFKEASGDGWKDVRKGIENAWDELGQAPADLGKGVRKAVERFTDDKPDKD